MKYLQLSSNWHASWQVSREEIPSKFSKSEPSNLQYPSVKSWKEKETAFKMYLPSTIKCFSPAMRQIYMVFVNEWTQSLLTAESNSCDECLFSTNSLFSNSWWEAEVFHYQPLFSFLMIDWLALLKNLVIIDKYSQCKDHH